MKLADGLYMASRKRRPKLPSRRAASTKRARASGIVRPKDLDMTRSQLVRLVGRGEIERVARGLYRLGDADVTAQHTVALVAKRVPHGVVCLLSALSLHDVGTQIPHEVWIAIDRKARKPEASGLPVRIVRSSAAALARDVERRVIEGIPVMVTNPARTVVDCFRYRNKIGLDVALEALTEALRTKRVTPGGIRAVATSNRALAVIRPYLEAITWR
jgi:predicted transcriptional regulator of viral defense system